MTAWWYSAPALTESDRRLLDTATADPAIAGDVPTERVALARRRAASLVEQVTASFEPDVVRHSVLGPEWSGDLDLHWSRPPTDDIFVAAGWRDVSGVLERLGRRGCRRWAIVDDGEVVGAADLLEGPAPSPTTSVARRLRRGPTVRSVLEVRALQRLGVSMSATPELARVAELERRLGGTEIEVEPVSTRRRVESMVRSTVARRPRRRRPRIVVALSGVDGAGKSSVIRQFTHELSLSGLPFTVLWARPGQELGWLNAVARLAKRALGHQPEPGFRAISADAHARPPSRRGVTGRLWALLMLADYCVRARRAGSRASGIVVHDRHALDAAVTLGFAYGLDRPWVLPLVQRAMSRPDLHVYLDIDATTASVRKPADPMGPAAIEEQLRRYRDVMPHVPNLTILDATVQPSVLTGRLWTMLLERFG
jgi:thymidylate kinase